MKNNAQYRFGRTFRRVLVGFCIGGCLSVTLCTSIGFLFDSSQSSQNTAYNHALNDPPHVRNKWEEDTIDLQDLYTIKSPLERRKVTLSFLISTNRDDLHKLIGELAELPTGHVRIELQKSFFKHLALISPSEALALVWDQESTSWYELLSVVFDVWSVTEWQTAVSAVELLPPHFKFPALNAILLRRSDLTMPERSQIVSKLDHKSDARLLLTRTQVLQLLNEPWQAWKVVLSDDIDDESQEDLLVHIAAAWINDQGPAGYPLLFEALQTFEDRYDNSLASGVVREVATRDPLAAWASLPTLSRLTRSAISGSILATLSEQNVLQALDFVSKLNDSELKSNGYTVLVREWARRNPTEILKNLDLVPTAHRKIALDTSLEKLILQEPAVEVIKLLQKLNSQDENIVDAKQMFIRAWGRKEPKATLDWMIKVDKEDNWSWQEFDWHFVIKQLAVEDYSLALEYASTHEYTTASSIELQRWVIEALTHRGRFDDAKNALLEMDQFSDLGAYISFGRNLMEFNRVDEAIKLANNIPETDWNKYFRSISRAWFYLNPNQFLEGLVRFPNEKIKASVAQDILELTSTFYPIYSENEVNQLKAFLELEEES